jgi:hypothetical protein
MASPSLLFTARYVAEHLAVDAVLIEEIALDMDPEDGCLSVIDSADENASSITAFTSCGIEYLREIINAKTHAQASN